MYWWISQRKGCLDRLSSEAESLVRIWTSQGAAAGLNAVMVSCTALGCVQSTLWLRLRGWSNALYCHFERERLLEPSNPGQCEMRYHLSSKAKADRDPLSLLLYPALKLKASGYNWRFIGEKKKSKSTNMCEFKRDERNNQAEKCVPSSEGTAAVVWIAMRILGGCLLSSLLLSCEVVWAREVTRRCWGINSAGPPKVSIWE